MISQPHMTQSWKEGTFSTKNKTEIKFSVCYSDQDPPHQFIVIINGRNESHNKYHHVINDLSINSPCGFLFWDHQGQGQSSGDPSHIDSYEQFAKDTKDIIEHNIPVNIPYTIIAHSMGGLIALYSLSKNYIHPKRLILVSPFLGIPNKPFPAPISRLIALFFTFIGLGKTYVRKNGSNKPEEFSTNSRTHCPKNFMAIKNSRFPGKSITFGWLHASAQAQKHVFDKETIKSFRIPIHILFPEKETIVNATSIKKWAKDFKKAHPKLANFHLIKGAKHEILFEIKEYYDQAIAIINLAINE